MDGENKPKSIVELGAETQFRSGEEAAEKGRNGGIKSGESRRAKRDARQAAQRLLDMAAKGQMKDNLMQLGYDPKSEDGIRNIDVLVARLLVMSAGGNLQAADRLLKIAGYDSEENRAERESINADRRKDRESEARVEGLLNGNLSRYSSSFTDGDDEGSVEDVYIYLPDNGRDQHLQNYSPVPETEVGRKADTEVTETESSEQVSQ